MASDVARSGAPSSKPNSTWLWRSTKPIGQCCVSRVCAASNPSLPCEIARVTDRGGSLAAPKGRSMAQTEKRENSVLFSLRELRQIEENRVNEEEQAVRSAEQARVAAQQAEERRVREEAEAK